MLLYSIPSKALLNASHKFSELKSLKKLGISTLGASVDLKALMGFKERTVSGLTRGIESLLKKYGAEYIKGRGSFVSENEVLVDKTHQIYSKNFIIATGSYPAPFPGGIDICIDGESIVTSDQAIAFSQVPDHLVVVGAGVIGLELGSVWARLGSKVTVIDHSSQILSAADPDVSAALRKTLTSHEGMVFKDNAKITNCSKSECTILSNGVEEMIKFDKMLIATGRKPNTSDLGHIRIPLNEKGFIQVDEFLQVEGFSNIYAIGDCVPGPMLAHKASEEGIAVVDHISTGEGHYPIYANVPSVVYTSPEVAWVGVGENDPSVKRKGVFPMMANSRSRCNGVMDGFVKVLVDESDRIIGAHIVAENAGELIAPLTVAITYGASSKDMANVSHAHPTQHEAIKEACMAAHFKPIHF